MSSPMSYDERSRYPVHTHGGAALRYMPLRPFEPLTQVPGGVLPGPPQEAPAWGEGYVEGELRGRLCSRLQACYHDRMGAYLPLEVLADLLDRTVRLYGGAPVVGAHLQAPTWDALDAIVGVVIEDTAVPEPVLAWTTLRLEVRTAPSWQGQPHVLSEVLGRIEQELSRLGGQASNRAVRVDVRVVRLELWSAT